MGQGTRLALLGIGIGTLSALTLTHVIASLLFQTSSRDPLTFLGVAGLLLATALTSSYLPARRAMRVDPAVALRHE